jgi:hypothetical protein
MYIDYDLFKDFHKVIGDGEFISPGGLAHKFGVARQTVQYWIEKDVIDAIRYEGKEGKFVLINMKQCDAIRKFRGNRQ